VAIAYLGCGIAFVLGRNIGSNLSEKDGLALTQTVSIGIFALFIVLIGQLIFSIFGGGTPTWLEIVISGIGVFLFAGSAVVDFTSCPVPTEMNSISVLLYRCIRPISTYLSLFCAF